MWAYAKGMNDWPELRELEIFLAVIRSGSIGAAAKALGISQPQASRTVARLEKAAGGKLLQRTPRGSQPTALGESYALKCDELLTAGSKFIDWVRDLTNTQISSTLTVGASLTIAETLVPTWVRTLRSQLPQTLVDVRVANSTQVIHELRSGKLDLGLIETTDVPSDLHHLHLGEDFLCVVVSPEHPWAERTEPLSLEELASTPLVVRESGSGTRSTLEGYLLGQRLAEPYQVLHSNMAVRIATQSGAAPAVLSYLAVQEHIRAGLLVSVPVDAPLVRPLTVIWHGPQNLPPTAAHFLRVASASF